MKIALVIGQATGPGRLTAAADALREMLEREGASVATVDLHAAPVEICDGRPEEAYGAATREAITRVSTADGVVVVSPVYRATYPGVLKNLLDLLAVDALRGKPVAIVAVGATDHHYLGVDGDLRRVLAWFGALALPTSVYLSSASFDASKKPGAAATAELEALARSVATLAGRLGGAELGPVPLAARGR
jgi:FMN reductase